MRDLIHALKKALRGAVSIFAHERMVQRHRRSAIRDLPL